MRQFYTFIWIHYISAAVSAAVRLDGSGECPETQSVSVNVTLNQDNLQPGQDLVVGIDVQNPDTPATVDVFIGILFPDGKTVCFVTQASLPSCELTTMDAGPAAFPPLLENQEIPAGFSISVPNAFQLALPVGAPSGQYLQFVGVSPAGALDDDQIGPSDVIELEFQPFSVAGTSPATGAPSNAGTAALTDPSETRATNDPRLDLGAQDGPLVRSVIPPRRSRLFLHRFSRGRRSSPR